MTAEISQSELQRDTQSKLLGKLSSLVPYRVGVWILWQMSRSAISQRTLFRRDVKQLEGFVALVGPSIDHKSAMRRNFMAKGFKWINKWRKLALEPGQERLLRDLLPVSGLDKLDRAHSMGRGVVLVNSHFGGARFVPLVLARMGIELLSLNVFKQPRVVRSVNLKVIRLHGAFLAQAVLQAQKALRKGKVVHLAADGYAGKSGFFLTFHGRQRRFAAGFADLALSTGAVVLPVFAPIDEKGRVNIEFVEPLDSGNDSMTHSERVELLVRSYVRVLERRWSDDPGNVPTRHVEIFLSLPENGVITESPDLPFE